MVQYSQSPFAGKDVVRGKMLLFGKQVRIQRCLYVPSMATFLCKIQTHCGVSCRELALHLP